MSGFPIKNTLKHLFPMVVTVLIPIVLHPFTPHLLFLIHAWPVAQRYTLSPPRWLSL